MSPLSLHRRSFHDFEPVVSAKKCSIVQPKRRRAAALHKSQIANRKSQIHKIR
jgi:hypothetical protein